MTKEHYGKIFEDIFCSTLMDFGGDTAYVFMAMVVLSDSSGIIKHTANSLARLICKPAEVVEEAIRNLEAPDQASNMKGHEGRRIVPLCELNKDETRGWLVVNKVAYRSRASKEDKQKADRERIAEKRKRINDVASSREVSHGVADVAHADAYANTDAVKKKGSANALPVNGQAVDLLPACPHEQIISAYHEALPMCPRVIEWTDARAKVMRTRWREKSKPNGKHKGYTTLDEGLAYWKRFFAWVAQSEFLTGRGPSRKDKGPFMANLEWLITAGNFAKVIEGNYHG